LQFEGATAHAARRSFNEENLNEDRGEKNGD